MSGNSETVTKTYTDNFMEEVLTSGRARVSGQYKCQACNNFGCSTSNNKSATANIFVAGSPFFLPQNSLPSIYVLCFARFLTTMIYSQPSLLMRLANTRKTRTTVYLFHSYSVNRCSKWNRNDKNTIR